MKQPFQLANDLVAALELPERLDLTEARAAFSDAPCIYINDFRVVGGDPALGENVIRRRSVRSKDILQAMPTAALRKIHAAVCGF